MLFIFFMVCGCSVYNSSYSTEVVSNKNTRSLINSNESEEILKANVIIYNNNYSSFLGIKYKEHNTYGSGFIYDSDDNYYYVLTNNHVISFDYSYNKNKLKLEDYYGNKYDVELIYKDINYDLAVVRFVKSIELKVLNLSDATVNVKDSIRTMGNPDSNRNVISEGAISCFSNIDFSNEESNVDFEVIVHNARIKGGSSGGALLNSNDEVIGITFAGVFDNEGSFVTGYAIPVNRINEFLSKYI